MASVQKIFNMCTFSYLFQGVLQNGTTSAVPNQLLGIAHHHSNRDGIAHLAHHHSNRDCQAHYGTHHLLASN